MPKYLVVANYTSDGMRGVLDKGGSSRRDALEAACADVGGSLDSFYFAFGADDVFVTVEAPDNTAVAALCARVSATGLAATRTIVLLTPEEMDAAAKLSINYRPPGR